MFSSVSPYELLRASIPKSAPTVVTPYDLYSQIQHAEPYPTQEMSPAMHLPAQPPAAPPSEKRTHYIADIHKKHGAADRRTSYVSSPIR